jgi:hypothetical protein
MVNVVVVPLLWWGFSRIAHDPFVPGQVVRMTALFTFMTASQAISRGARSSWAARPRWALPALTGAVLFIIEAVVQLVTGWTARSALFALIWAGVGFLLAFVVFPAVPRRSPA